MSEFSSISMRNKTPEKAAEEYARGHVLYADEPGRLDGYLMQLKNSPESFPEAATCDGCIDDAIAVYQAFLAGDANGYERGKREERQRIWENFVSTIYADGDTMSLKYIKQIVFGGSDEKAK